MSKVIIQVLKLEPPFPDVANPNQTLYIDATAAQHLGMSDLLITGEIANIHFIVKNKSRLMNGVLHSLEFPFGNIIRLTESALRFFNLKNGKKYWMEWNKSTKKLIVLRELKGK